VSEPQDTQPPEETKPVDRAALDKARRGRNIALAVGLVTFIVIVYVVTLTRMGGYVAERPF
jgi:hypothetical protein